MRKALREVIRIAEREGIERPRVEAAALTRHCLLCGLVDGQAVQMVFSATKAIRDERHLRSTILNIRRTVRAARLQPQT
jgi:hypothetical protein